ncbi:MAG: type II toxin-antitoxin system VapB family antitoxin, partial [Tepidisphaeraceae bacterium]
ILDGAGLAGSGLIQDSKSPIIGFVKTTIDIPDDVMKDAMKLTKASTKRDAVVRAMREYIRREKLAKLVRHFGTFKDFMTQEELREMREERGRYGRSR